MLLVPHPAGIASRACRDHLVFLAAQAHAIFELLAELPDLLVGIRGTGRWGRCRLLVELRIMGCSRDQSANAESSRLMRLEGRCLGWNREKGGWTGKALLGGRSVLPE